MPYEPVQEMSQVHDGKTSKIKHINVATFAVLMRTILLKNRRYRREKRKSLRLTIDKIRGTKTKQLYRKHNTTQRNKARPTLYIPTAI